MSKTNTDRKYNFSDEQLHDLFLKINDVTDFRINFNYQFSLLNIILSYYEEYYITDNTPDEIYLIINEFQKLNNFYSTFNGMFDDIQAYLDNILNKKADIDEFNRRCDEYNQDIINK